MDHNEYVDYLKDQADAAEADYHAQAEAEQRDREEIARLNARVAKLEAALAEAREDSARLDWLERFIQCGCADFGFELEGGLYLQLNSPGAETVDIREADNARAAIDSARGRT